MGLPVTLVNKKREILHPTTDFYFSLQVLFIPYSLAVQYFHSLYLHYPVW